MMQQHCDDCGKPTFQAELRELVVGRYGEDEVVTRHICPRCLFEDVAQSWKGEA